MAETNENRYRLSYDEVTNGLAEQENAYTGLPEAAPTGDGFHTTVRLERYDPGAGDWEEIDSESVDGPDAEASEPYDAAERRILARNGLEDRRIDVVAPWGDHTIEPEKSEAHSAESIMKGMLIPTDGRPHAIDIQQDENGSALHDLQRLVGGYIEPFDVIFGENVCLYVNEDGMGNCPPNRAVYATKNMVEEGYLSQMDYTSVVKEGELYTILWGDIVAVGFDPATGMDRDLTDAEIAQVGDYFTKVSAPGSGLAEALAIQQGRRREEPVQEHGVCLKDEADASRDASDALGGGQTPDKPQRGMDGR